MVVKLLITYQILLINLFLTHALAKRKYKNWVTFGVLFSFTLLLSIILSYTSPLFANETPSPWFVFTGALYIVPLYLIYKMRVGKLVLIMIYCWTYTMVLTASAVGLDQYIHVFSSNLDILLIQTFLFVLTFYPVLRFTKNKFMIIVHNTSDAIRYSLMILGISMFSALTAVRYFILPQEQMYYVLVFLITIIVITAYHLLFHTVESNINLNTAKQIVYKDALTGIANRYSLFRDLHTSILNNQAFMLLFLDLDGLKQVNDTFGHNKGDAYLIRFANTLVKQLHKQGSSYRFAGDEFVCIVPKGSKPLDIVEFEQGIHSEMNKYLSFTGVSIGQSEYPKDGHDPDLLLQVADSRMYRAKNSKKIRRPQVMKA